MFANSPSLETLRRLRPLARFTDTQLMTIRRCMEVKQAEDQQLLLDYGSTRDHFLFVLEGSVQLQDQNGDMHSLNFDANDQLNPIAPVRPSRFEIKASGNVDYLELEKELLLDFANVCEGGDISTFQLQMIDRDKEINPLVVSLFEDVMADRVNLPSLPNVAMRIQHEMEQPNLSSDSIARVLMSDPAITAKLIKVANSPVYQGVAATETLQAAITRLGLDTTYKLVMVYAVKDLFSSESALVGEYMNSLMSHSRRVAAISRILAQKSGLFKPDQAMLAGLIHDLGVIVILQYLQNFLDISDSHKIDLIVSMMRPRVTSLLLRNWNFSDELVTVAEHCEDWFRNQQEQADLCDLVMVAQYHSFLGQNELVNVPPVSLIPAMTKLHMNYDDSVQLIQDSMREIREIERILQ